MLPSLISQPKTPNKVSNKFQYDLYKLSVSSSPFIEEETTPSKPVPHSVDETYEYVSPSGKRIRIKQEKETSKLETTPKARKSLRNEKFGIVETPEGKCSCLDHRILPN